MGCAVCHDHKLESRYHAKGVTPGLLDFQQHFGERDGWECVIASPQPGFANERAQEKEIADLEVHLKDLNAAARERVASLNYIGSSSSHHEHSTTTACKNAGLDRQGFSCGRGSEGE